MRWPPWKRITPWPRGSLTNALLHLEVARHAMRERRLTDATSHLDICRQYLQKSRKEPKK